MEFSAAFAALVSDAGRRSSCDVIRVVDVARLFRLFLRDPAKRLEVGSLTRVAVVQERGFTVTKACKLETTRYRRVVVTMNLRWERFDLFRTRADLDEESNVEINRERELRFDVAAIAGSRGRERVQHQSKRLSRHAERGEHRDARREKRYRPHSQLRASIRR